MAELSKFMMQLVKVTSYSCCYLIVQLRAELKCSTESNF